MNNHFSLVSEGGNWKLCRILSKVTQMDIANHYK